MFNMLLALEGTMKKLRRTSRIDTGRSCTFIQEGYGVHVRWSTQHPPRNLQGDALATYQQASEAFMLKLAEHLGGPILVVDPFGNGGQQPG
jgi:hypothetical protein